MTPLHYVKLMEHRMNPVGSVEPRGYYVCRALKPLNKPDVVNSEMLLLAYLGYTNKVTIENVILNYDTVEIYFEDKN